MEKTIAYVSMNGETYPIVLTKHANQRMYERANSDMITVGKLLSDTLNNKNVLRLLSNYIEEGEKFVLDIHNNYSFCIDFNKNQYNRCKEFTIITMGYNLFRNSYDEKIIKFCNGNAILCKWSDIKKMEVAVAL